MNIAFRHSQQYYPTCRLATIGDLGWQNKCHQQKCEYFLFAQTLRFVYWLTYKIVCWPTFLIFQPLTFYKFIGCLFTEEIVNLQTLA